MSSWYKKENNKFVIDIQIDDIDQMYDKRDPTPFKKKDLDDDAYEYILTSAYEIGKTKYNKIKIIIKDQPSEERVSSLKYAIKDFFEYRQYITYKKFKNILFQGLKSLIIGLLFLAFSIAFANSSYQFIDNSFFKEFFKELCLLIGWVSMWKPVNIFLYEWWPLRDQFQHLKSLSRCEIEIKTPD